MSALHRWSNLAGVLIPFLGFVVAVVLLWNTLEISRERQQQKLA